jgi:hypothetical protein
MKKKEKEKRPKVNLIFSHVNHTLDPQIGPSNWSLAPGVKNP